jgi:hypothetical protein
LRRLYCTFDSLCEESGGWRCYGERGRATAEKHNVTVSAQPSHGLMFTELSWDEIRAPGAYLERGGGDLYRGPQEAIGPASPLIKKHSLGASRLVRITNNPFVTTLETHMLCAEVNIDLNF